MSLLHLNIIRSLILLLFTQTAHAALIWDWSFPESNITLLPTESFYIGGTITNDITSTENLSIDTYALSVSGGDLSFNDLFGGLYTDNLTAFETGGLIINNQPAFLAPGDSYTFNIMHFNPIQPISVGTQISLTLVLYDTPSSESIANTINSTVVPLPPSIFLMVTGLLSLLIVNKSNKQA